MVYNILIGKIENVMLNYSGNTVFIFGIDYHTCFTQIILFPFLAFKNVKFYLNLNIFVTTDIPFQLQQYTIPWTTIYNILIIIKKIMRQRYIFVYIVQKHLFSLFINQIVFICVMIIGLLCNININTIILELHVI